MEEGESPLIKWQLKSKCLDSVSEVKADEVRCHVISATASFCSVSPGTSVRPTKGGHRRAESSACSSPSSSPSSWQQRIQSLGALMEQP